MYIITYDQAKQAPFTAMLTAYFSELKSGIPEHIIRGKLLDLILGLHHQNTLHIALAIEDSPIGFAIYQIDSPASDWCKKEGWGCIREFFIVKEHRHKGFGTALAAYGERHLRLLGAEQLYLTADDAIPFWKHCGYHNTDKICSNDLEIMTK